MRNNARHARNKAVVNAARNARYATDQAYYAKRQQEQKEAYARHAEWRRLCVTLRLHNLTLDQYHALHERQDFSCAICGNELQSGKHGTHIDHDHASERVRGLLCNGCNLGLGHFRERPEALMAAADYVLQ